MTQSARVRRLIVRALIVGLLFVGAAFNPWLRLVEVRGSSMWPWLEDGDLLLVRFSSQLPENGSVVLIESESGSSGRLKRLVARSGEWLAVRDGNVEIGPRSDEESLRPVPRSTAAILDVAAPVIAVAGLDQADIVGHDAARPQRAAAASLVVMEGSGSLADGGGSFLLVGKPRGRLRLPGDEIRDDHLTDPTTTAPPSRTRGAHVVGDIIVDVAGPSLEPHEVLEFRHRLAAVEGADESVKLWRDESGWHIEARGVGGSSAAAHRLDAANWRLRIFWIDRRTIVEWLDPLSAEKVGASLELARPAVRQPEHSHVEVILDGDSVQFTRLDIHRDIHYISIQDSATSTFTKDPGTPIMVPEGRVWVLGDNSAISEDSRQLGAIAADRVIGRPWRIVWPWRRTRRLD